MLKINSPLFKLITILFRQMNLSIGRYSTEEDFYAYFNDKHIYYKYAIVELDKILYHSPAYSSFGDMVKKTFFTRKLRHLYALLVYKVLKEFDEMLDSREFDYMLREKKTHLSSGQIYWGLLRKKISRRERRIIDETEHFGQNLVYSHYKSIEENLFRLNASLEIE